MSACLLKGLAQVQRAGLSRCFIPGMCAVYMEASEVLEVYRWMRPARNHGLVELVHVLTDVHKLPDWRHTCAQVRSQHHHRSCMELVATTWLFMTHMVS